MINILTNAFLKNPVALQFTGNYCSHNCSYCFANINSPTRKLDINNLASILRNFKTRDDLVSHYMREKYPIIISNNIDPFSKSNQPIVNDLVLQLQDCGIPVAFATRGGIGWQELIKEITPSVYFVSIPYNTEDTKNKYEPYAPTLEHRYELIEQCILAGHKVILNINPFNPKFAPYPIEIAERAMKLGVKSILINKIHLTPKQQANMNTWQRESIGAELLSEAMTKDYTDQWIDNAIRLQQWCKENDMNLIGLDTGGPNKAYIEFAQCYPKILPIVDGFFNWVDTNKKNGDYIYFEDFYNYFAPKLPTIETNISVFVFQKTVLDDKSSYKKTLLSNLLHYYWQVKGVELGLAKNYPAFSWIKEQTKTKLDFMTDNEGNKVLLYHPEKLNVKDYTII